MAKLFTARLTGEEEVPPVRTAAFGRAVFRLSANGEKLHYRLIVFQLRKFTQAHIHIGARGVNGPVVAFLFGFTSPGISVNRGIVRGTITRDNLVGPLKGKPLSALIARMKAGRTYVNAHTARHPDGEIRGQIRRLPLCDRRRKS